MEQGAEISRLQRQLTVLDKEKQEALQKADEFGKVLNDAEGTIEIIQQDLQTTEAENQVSHFLNAFLFPKIPGIESENRGIGESHLRKECPDQKA